MTNSNDYSLMKKATVNQGSIIQGEGQKNSDNFIGEYCSAIVITNFRQEIKDSEAHVISEIGLIVKKLSEKGMTLDLPFLISQLKLADMYSFDKEGGIIKTYMLILMLQEPVYVINRHHIIRSSKETTISSTTSRSKGYNYHAEYGVTMVKESNYENATLVGIIRGGTRVESSILPQQIQPMLEDLLPDAQLQLLSLPVYTIMDTTSGVKKRSLSCYMLMNLSGVVTTEECQKTLNIQNNKSVILSIRNQRQLQMYSKRETHDNSAMPEGVRVTQVVTIIQCLHQATTAQHIIDAIPPGLQNLIDAVVVRPQYPKVGSKVMVEALITIKKGSSQFNLSKRYINPLASEEATITITQTDFHTEEGGSGNNNLYKVTTTDMISKSAETGVSVKSDKVLQSAQGFTVVTKGGKTTINKNNK